MSVSDVRNPELPRCSWANPKNPLYIAYHDEEWGVPLYEETRLFEMLILEGFQAGLSWETILNKREHFRKAFHQFIPERVGVMSDNELETLMVNPQIIRNRRKIFATRQNARVFLDIQKESGSFSQYLWGFIQHKPLSPEFTSSQEIPTKTPESEAISQALKKRGMSFVGPTIIYAYMQAIGMTNDHLTTCFRHQEI